MSSPSSSSTSTSSSSESPSDHESSSDSAPKTPPAKGPATPYSRRTTSVYLASSSLLTIQGHSLSPSHSIPASADEILFHNPPDPKFTLPRHVKELLQNESLLKDLPDSDLLKALHKYTAEFYDAKGWENLMGRSMDESALLAIGVLLEEFAREMVGEEGNRVFLRDNEDI